MKYSVSWWGLAIAFLALGVCSASEFRDDQTRDAEVVVSVRNGVGDAVANVPLAITRKSGLTFGKTDSQGNWHVNVRLALDSQQECIKVISESLIARGPNANDATSQRVREVKESYAVPSTILVQTATVQQQYNLAIVLPEAVRVSLNISDGASPLDAAIVVSGRDAYARTDANGSSIVGGVAKGQDCTLFVREVKKSSVRAFDVPATSLQADVNIGTKVLSFPTATCVCTFTVTNRDLLKRDPLPTKEYVTAVSTNGQDFYAFPINDQSVCFDSFTTDRKARLPVGEYYLVPGNAGLGRYASATRKLLIDGRAADLQTAQVPRVVIAAEQTTCSSTVDMEATRAAIAQLAGLSY